MPQVSTNSKALLSNFGSVQCRGAIEVQRIRVSPPVAALLREKGSSFCAFYCILHMRAEF